MAIPSSVGGCAGAGAELGKGSILSPWVSMGAHGQDEHISKLSVGTSLSMLADQGQVQQVLGANEES